jgi:hypothetical protein
MAAAEHRVQPKLFYCALVSCHTLARRGKLDEARAAVGVGLTLDPTFTIRRFRDSAVSDNPAYLAARQRAIESLREVGLLEE